MGINDLDSTKRYVARELYNALQPLNPPKELAEAA